MALVRCILAMLLGVACHCFPPDVYIQTIFAIYDIADLRRNGNSIVSLGASVRRMGDHQNSAM